MRRSARKQRQLVLVVAVGIVALEGAHVQRGSIGAGWRRHLWSG